MRRTSGCVRACVREWRRVRASSRGCGGGVSFSSLPSALDALRMFMWGLAVCRLVVACCHPYVARCATGAFNLARCAIEADMQQGKQRLAEVAQ